MPAQKKPPRPLDLGGINGARGIRTPKPFPNMLRQLAVGLSVYDPDHVLHDHMMSIASRGSEISQEGRRHLADMDLATTSAAIHLTPARMDSSL